MLTAEQQELLNGYIYERSVGNTSPTLNTIMNTFNTPESMSDARDFLNQAGLEALSRPPTMNIFKWSYNSIGLAFVVSAFEHIRQSIAAGTFSTSDEERSLRQNIFLFVTALSLIAGFAGHSWRVMGHAAVVIRMTRALNYFEAQLATSTPEHNVRVTPNASAT